MPRHTDRNPGWAARKQKAADKKAREQAAAKRGQAMSIGKGGITIKDGGSLVSRYPASMGGGEATRFGPIYTSETSGYAFQLKDENEEFIFVAVRNLPDADIPNGANGLFTFADTTFINSKDGTAGLSIFQNNSEITGGQIRLIASTGGTRIDHSTTGASANCFIDPSDGRIWRSTSSRRYKQDIADIDIDPASVLQMQPRTWRDKAEVEQDAATETRYVGFIAEELHDLGLTQFVVYDDEDKPEAIAYDRLSAALVTVAQDQQRQIDALSERLDALESREG